MLRYPKRFIVELDEKFQPDACYIYGVGRADRYFTKKEINSILLENNLKKELIGEGTVSRKNKI